MMDSTWAASRLFDLKIISKIEPKSRDDNGNVTMVSVTMDVNRTLSTVEKSFDYLNFLVCIEEQEVNQFFKTDSDLSPPYIMMKYIIIFLLKAIRLFVHTHTFSYLFYLFLAACCKYIFPMLYFINYKIKIQLICEKPFC